MPAVTMVAIKKEVGKFKVDKVTMKITSKVTEKDKMYFAGTIALADAAGDADDCIAKVADFLKAKKTMLVLTGVLIEDDKGKQKLEMTKCDEVTKPEKK